MKRLLALVLVLSFVFALMACNGNNTMSNSTDTTKNANSDEILNAEKTLLPFNSSRNIVTLNANTTVAK